MEQQHKGEIVELAVRKSGYPIVKLAKKLGITRNTLYNRFKTENLNSEFILKVGQIIRYDFLNDFPSLKNHSAYKALMAEKYLSSSNMTEMEYKYIQILEKYSELLSFLIRITNGPILQELKKEMEHFHDLP